MYSVEYGHENVAKLLMQNSKIDLNAIDEFGNTALILA